MGSGRGQQRRARINAVASEAAYDKKVWEEFAQAEGIADLKLYEYYLDGDASWIGEDKQLADAPAEKIINELFSDAVEIGALVLPAGYTRDDFKIEIRRMGDSNGRGMCILLNSAPEMKTFHNYGVITAVYPHTEVSHRYINGVFSNIVRAANELAMYDPAPPLVVVAESPPTRA
jgi:hypothetical protein